MDTKTQLSNLLFFSRTTDLSGDYTILTQMATGSPDVNHMMSRSPKAFFALSPVGLRTATAQEEVTQYKDVMLVPSNALEYL